MWRRRRRCISISIYPRDDIFSNFILYSHYVRSNRLFCGRKWLPGGGCGGSRSGLHFLYLKFFVFHLFALQRWKWSIDRRIFWLIINQFYGQFDCGTNVNRPRVDGCHHLPTTHDDNNVSFYFPGQNGFNRSARGWIEIMNPLSLRNSRNISSFFLRHPSRERECAYRDRRMPFFFNYSKDFLHIRTFHPFFCMLANVVSMLANRGYS